MAKRSNLKAGDKIGMLTILSEVEPNITPGGTKQRRFSCKCECGNTVVRYLSALTRKSDISCGCSYTPLVEYTRKYTDEQRNSFLYSTWSGIKQRCYDPNSSSYSRYGGRGIRMCDEWHYDYLKFYEWSLANGAAKHLTIDRIDNSGNYEPSNCRWVDDFTQANNKRNNRVVEYNGQRKTIIEWARELGIGESTIRCRIDKYGYSIGEALGFEKRKAVKQDRSNRRKPVLQYTVDGDFIKEWPSVQEIHDTLGYSMRSIRLCVAGYYKTGNGYAWRYKDQFKKNLRLAKNVLQYDVNGNFIAKYIDLREASKQTGISVDTLRDACIGKRDHKVFNFIFKYE